jgi:hypothetical protein
MDDPKSGPGNQRKKRETKADKEAARRKRRLEDAARSALADIAAGRPLLALRVAAGVPASAAEESVTSLGSANPWRTPTPQVARTWVLAALRGVVNDVREVARLIESSAAVNPDPNMEFVTPPIPFFAGDE